MSVTSMLRFDDRLLEHLSSEAVNSLQTIRLKGVSSREGVNALQEPAKRRILYIRDSLDAETWCVHCAHSADEEKG